MSTEQVTENIVPLNVVPPEAEPKKEARTTRSTLKHTPKRASDKEKANVRKASSKKGAVKKSKKVIKLKTKGVTKARRKSRDAGTKAQTQVPLDWMADIKKMAKTQKERPADIVREAIRKFLGKPKQAA